MKPSGGWRGAFPPTQWFGINHSSPQSAGLEFWIPVMRPRNLFTVRDLVRGAFQNSALIGNGTTYGPDPVFGFGVNFANNFSKLVINSPSDPANSWFVSLPYFSVTAWIRPTAIQGTIISRSGPTNPTTDPFLLWFQAVNNLRFTVVDSLGTRYDHDAGGTWAAGQLYHVAAVYDGAALRCYQDGMQIGSTTAMTGVTINSNTPINLGNINASGSGFRGRILEVRIYSRALTPENIWQMFDPPTRFDLYQPVEPPKYWANGPGTFAEAASLDREHGLTVTASVVSGGGSPGVTPTILIERLHSQAGMSWLVHAPLAEGGAYLFDLSSSIASWSHTSQADGGYWAARAGLAGKQVDLEGWIERGLGRRIIAYDPELLVVWDGFVNAVNLNLGGLTYKLGPLLSIANYAYAVYSTVDTSVSPPAVGVRAVTAVQQSAASVAKYGRIEKVLSMGGATAANAAQLVLTYLNENAWPEATQTVTPGAGNAPAVSLELCGHTRWLETYHYNTTGTGTTTSRARIIAAMGASPSITFSTDYGEMDANATAIPTEDASDKTAWDAIKAAVAPGDPADNARYTFGIYDNLKARYKKMPTEVEYVYHLAGGSQEIETPTGARVRPWDVRPAKWLFVPDFLIGRVVEGTPTRQDPRNIFIESVTFTAPYGISINGGKVATLPQALAKLGLAGMGG